MEELKDKLEEQQADMEEKQEFFVRAGQIENEDELLDELNELEAEMAMEDFEGVDIATGAIEGVEEKVQPQKQPAGKAKVQSEEDELRALEQLMA